MCAVPRETIFNDSPPQRHQNRAGEWTLKRKYGIILNSLVRNAQTCSDYWFYFRLLLSEKFLRDVDLY